MLLIIRILLARWLTISIAVAFCILGGVTAIIISPARYDAKARVTVNFVKPDPITGQYVDSKQISAYVESQIRMVEDMQVAANAVQQSGWLDSQEFSELYQARDPDDTRDPLTWGAARILPAISARMIQDSNILQIRYRSVSRETALAMVTALRDAYIEVSVLERRATALEQARQAQADADTARAEILRLQAEKGAYERETGIVLREDSVDLDTLQMRALAAPPAQDNARPRIGGLSDRERFLTNLDAQIANAQAVFGPNHPQLAALKQNRTTVAAEVAAQDAGSTYRDDFAASAERSRVIQFEGKKSQVLGQRDEVMHLQLLQDRINEQRAKFSTATAMAGKMREMSTIVESGISIFGEPESVPKPAFPDKRLILGGALGFGLIGGVCLALLSELLNLKVRTSAGLSAAVPVPLLGVLPRVASVGPPRRLRWPTFSQGRRLRPVAAQ